MSPPGEAVSAFDNIRRDLTESLAPWFAPTDIGIVADLPEGGLALEEGVAVCEDRERNTTAVGWRFHCIQHQPLHGIHPTPDLEVVIRGATIVTVEPDGQLLFHRYVDWLDVYAQLGQTDGGRRVVNPHVGPEPGR